MKHLAKQTSSKGKRALALVLVLAVLASMCAVGFAVSVAAAGSKTIYIDVEANSDWKNKTVVATFDGANPVTLTQSGNMLSGVMPAAASGASKMTLTAYPSGYPTSLATSVPSGSYRIIWKPGSSGKTYVYAWNSSSDRNADWPGQQGTASGDFRYKDLTKAFKYVILNGNSDKNKTSDLTVKWSGNVAYYDGSSFAVPKTASVSISSLADRNLFYMNTDNSLSISKYQYSGSGIDTEWKTVYLYNADWNAAYVTYDLNDAYKTTVGMTLDTSNGVEYFEAQVPVGATFKFSPSASSTASGSASLTAPTDDKNLYVMDSQKYWTTLDKLPQKVTRIPNNFEAGIHGVTATYYDYLEDQEISNGYMNANTYGYWERYHNKLNRAISNYSQTNQIVTPLYFGNLNGQSGDVNAHTATYYNYNNIANNSANLKNFWYSVQGLASHTLYGSQIFAPANNGAGAAEMPIFDQAWLTDGSVNGSGSALARVYKSYFPFVETTEGDVTTYSFDSSGGGVRQNNGSIANASRSKSDNVYFTWDGDQPVAVNYGKGSNYAVTDGGAEFNVNDAVGFGIFPFNNTSSTRTVSTGESITVPSDEIWIKKADGYTTVALYLFGNGNNGSPKALPRNSSGYYVITKQTVGDYPRFILTSEDRGWSHQTADLYFSSYPLGKCYEYSNEALSTNGVSSIPVTYSKSLSDDRLNYGFGIQLDMDFRVPEGGRLASTTVSVPENEIWIESSENSLFVHAWDNGSANKISKTLSKNSAGCFVLDSEITSRKYFLVAKNSSYTNKTGDLTVSGYKGAIWKYSGSSLTSTGKSTVTSGGQPVTFKYSGDDDLWVYITDDSGHSELVLDLGGAHKFTSGELDFSTMTSTADFVHVNYDVDHDEFAAVPSDEFWISKTHEGSGGPYTSMYVKTWDKTDEEGNHVDTYYAPFEVSTYTFSNGTTETFFKFKTSILGSSTAITLNTDQTDDSEVSTIEDLATLGGKALILRYRNGVNKPEEYAVTTGGSTQQGTITKSFFGGQTLDPNRTYHMTVFYTERGLIESNFKVEFTMTPVKNNLLVDKVVEGYEDVNNSEMAKAVQIDDTFGYSSASDGQPANGKSYTFTDRSGNAIGKVSGTDGSFGLKDGESAYFVSQFQTGSTISVTEESATNLEGHPTATLADRYDTRWQLFDNGILIDQGDGYDASFRLVGHEANADHTENAERKAELELTYYNRLRTGDLIVAKQVLNKQNQDITADVHDDFTFQVLFDLDGTTEFTSYPFYYEVGSLSGTTFTAESTHYTDDGVFTFSPQKAVRIYGLPVGARYRIDETVPAGYMLQSGNGVIGYVGSTGVSTFVNKQSTGEGVVTFTKSVDNKAYTGSDFAFKMDWLTPPASTADKSYVQSADVATDSVTVRSVTNGQAQFVLSFTHVGWYRYVIYEDTLTRQMQNQYYKGDAKRYYVEFEIVDDGGDLKISNTASGKVIYYTDDTFTVQDPSQSGASFKNTVEPAKIIVTKENEDGDPVNGTQFAVVKVAAQPDTLPENIVERINSLITANVNLNKGAATQTMNVEINGQQTTAAAVVYDNLPIYQNGDQVYNVTTGQWVSAANYVTGDDVPQTYMVFEYSPTNGYNSNKTLKFVTFPYEGKLETTFGYVDAAVMMPESSGGGMNGFLAAGVGILGTSLLLAAVYLTYQRVSRAKRRSRHSGR